MLASLGRPLRFDAFMELALYHPDGFYGRDGSYESSGPSRGPGRLGDFITSPELGPLYGAVLARALDRWWVDMGSPEQFVVAEVGAGPGSLAAAVAAAHPQCAPALRYVMVDRVPSWRRHQARRLASDGLTLEDPRQVFGAGPGGGPLFASTTEVPAGPMVGVILANELLDNLPVRILCRGESGWEELYRGVDGREVLIPADPDTSARAAALAPAAPVGGRLAICDAASDWLAQALGILEWGRLVVVDYTDTTAAMAARPWRDWLRTYRSHGPGGDPLADVGTQDITCEVAGDQLAAVRAPDLVRTQAEFLAHHGIGALVEEAAARWRAEAASPSLSSLAARSRLGEADALCDPGGMGSFTVMEWTLPYRG